MPVAWGFDLMATLDGGPKLWLVKGFIERYTMVYTGLIARICPFQHHLSKLSNPWMLEEVE